MAHLLNLQQAQLTQPSIVSIGVFDGVHLGHQQLIQRLVSTAKQVNLKSVVLTFFPHPDALLHDKEGRYYLTTPEDRAELLMNLGVDYVITHPFDESVRQIRASEFVKLLCQHLKMSALWVGSDFALGYEREGNTAFLRKEGTQHNFTVETIDLVTHAPDGTVISSTQIRQRLLSGDVDSVREWLGRAYSVQGVVVHGDQRGRTIGFPTANLGVWVEQIIPANGVYAGWATVRGQRYMAVTNIGIRPTFGGQEIRIEPHLLDFSQDIYDETLHLTFEKRLRPEQKFEGIQALKAQLQQDIEQGRAFLSSQT
jgi:riboflavin kinase / FMN adenylyltransferase